MSVTAAKGFRAAGVSAGLKKSGAPDLALVVNDGPVHSAAGVFTSNRIFAAPVRWSREVVADGRLTAVVLNSGGANACTGQVGYDDSRATAEAVATAVGTVPGEVAVCSTGLIGERLPMDLILGGVESAVIALSDCPASGAAAAEAIRTTDTVRKESAVTSGGWTVGGMAKGAGMLAPGLATMLVVITTDAVVEPGDCDRALRAATRISFDRVDSDGCMSTNDTVLLLASGASDVRPPYADFESALTAVCADLARQLIADAEGASKDIAVVVSGAVDEDEAVAAARTIARSNLLKCAVHGQDPNWGRVLAALGTTAVAFDPDDVDVSINGVMVCRAGAIGDPRGLVDMTSRDVVIKVDLHAGPATATVWTNDLTADYVHENSAYSS